MALIRRWLPYTVTTIHMQIRLYDLYRILLHNIIPIVTSPGSLELCTVPTETIVTVLVGGSTLTVVVLSRTQSSALEKSHSS